MSIQFQGKITFGDADTDGDVEIEVETRDRYSAYVFLTQNEIKNLIDFLEKQIRK